MRGVKVAGLLCAFVALALNCLPVAQAKLEENRATYSEDKDGENALNLEDYARAYSIYSDRLAGKPYGAQEGYVRTCLGESLLWQGRFSEAAKELKKAYAIIDKMQPESSALRARVLDDLSWLKQAQNDPDAAAQYAKQALAALKGMDNADPTQQCELFEHLATLSKNAGRYSKAVDYFKQALAIRAKTQGDQSLQTADVKERLSGVLRLTGDSAAADAMYAQALQVKWILPALTAKYSPHPYYDTVMYRYYPGVSNCAVTGHLGPNTESINIRGVTVSAALISTGKELGKNCRVDIAVMNDTPSVIQLLPISPELVVLAPKVAISHIVNPDSLANKIESKGNKSAKWVRFWGADATTPVTSTFIGHPGVWGFPPVTSYNGVAPFVSRNGDITTVTSQVPDYLAQARALQKAAAIEDKSRAQADAIRESMISQTTIQPGANVSGSLYFDAVNPQKSQLHIPVGNAVFEFDFPPDGG